METVFVVLLIVVLIGVVTILIKFFNPHAAFERLQDVLEDNALLSRPDGLIGTSGRTLCAVGRRTGQVEIDGELWEARTDNSEEIGKGEMIQVDRVESTLVFVSRFRHK